MKCDVTSFDNVSSLCHHLRYGWTPAVAKCMAKASNTTLHPAMAPTMSDLIMDQLADVNRTSLSAKSKAPFQKFFNFYTSPSVLGKRGKGMKTTKAGKFKTKILSC